MISRDYGIADVSDCKFNNNIPKTNIKGLIYKTSPAFWRCGESTVFLGRAGSVLPQLRNGPSEGLRRAVREHERGRSGMQESLFRNAVESESVTS